MDLTKDQQNSLVSILDEWVHSSRIIKNIPAQSCFVYYNEGRVHFNLRLLHEDYMLKFVFCNYRSYVNTLLDHIQPSLKRWLIRNNIDEYIFSFEFKSAGESTLKEIRIVLKGAFTQQDPGGYEKKYSWKGLFLDRFELLWSIKIKAGLFLFISTGTVMKKYEFSGEIQGKYRQIEIYPLSDSKQAYLIHWDGFEVGVISKNSGKWHTDHEALVDYTEELGEFIEVREKEIADSEWPRPE